MVTLPTPYPPTSLLLTVAAGPNSGELDDTVAAVIPAVSLSVLTDDDLDAITEILRVRLLDGHPEWLWRRHWEWTGGSLTVQDPIHEPDPEPVGDPEGA